MYTFTCTPPYGMLYSYINTTRVLLSKLTKFANIMPDVSDKQTHFYWFTFSGKINIPP